MTLASHRRQRSQPSEEAGAAARVVLGLTAAVGSLAALMGATTGQPIAVAGVPTLFLAVAVALGAVPIAGWSGMAVWATLLPSAHGEALLAPTAMMVLCLAVAIGPDRLLSWFARDAVSAAGRSVATDGWIEEDERRIG